MKRLNPRALFSGSMSFTVMLMTIFLFQNCSVVSGEGGLTNEQIQGGGDLSSSTPLTSSPTSSDTDFQVNLFSSHVVNRYYVGNLLRDVFTSTKYPISTLGTIVDKWVEFRGPQYGGSCNVYSSYTQKDCNNSAASVSVVDHFVDHNSLRESYRLQACDNILGLDAGIDAALEKVSLTRTSAISEASLSAAWSLFYRDEDASPEVVSTLLVMSKTLEASNVTLLNRWRAVLTEVCESPGWQIF